MGQDQREKDKEGWTRESGSGDLLAVSAESQEASSSEPLHCITLGTAHVNGTPGVVQCTDCTKGLCQHYRLFSSLLLVEAPIPTLKAEGPLAAHSGIRLYIHFISLAFMKIYSLVLQRSFR